MKAGCDPMEDGYSAKNVERMYRERIRELERQLAEAIARAEFSEDQYEVAILDRNHAEERMAETRSALAALVTKFSRRMDRHDRLRREDGETMPPDDEYADCIYAWALFVTWGELRRARAVINGLTEQE